MYEMTPTRRAAVDKIKTYHQWRYSYSEEPVMSGSWKESYRLYCEWCRKMRLPAAPLGVWASVTNSIGH